MSYCPWTSPAACRFFYMARRIGMIWLYCTRGVMRICGSGWKSSKHIYVLAAHALLARSATGSCPHDTHSSFLPSGHRTHVGTSDYSDTFKHTLARSLAHTIYTSWNCSMLITLIYTLHFFLSIHNASCCRRFQDCQKSRVNGPSPTSGGQVQAFRHDNAGENITSSSAFVWLQNCIRLSSISWLTAP